MSELPDDMIKEIAARVAKANSVSVSSVQTSSTVIPPARRPLKSNSC